MSKYVGTAMVKINGQLVKTVPKSVELNFGGATRTTTMADNTMNFSEEPTPSKLTFKALVTSQTDEKMINDLVNGTVEIIADVGKSWTMTSALRSGDPVSMSSNDGQLSVEISGDPIVP